MDESFLEGRVTVLTVDITTQDVAAIVNAANSTLLGGGGVDGAIHRAGGPQILNECRQIRETTHRQGLPAGEAVITSGGNLPARYVIHTVGPIYGRNPDLEAELLAACYQNSLRLAVQHSCSSIAFPSISTGAYGYPKEEAAVVSSKAIKDFLTADNQIREVRLVFFKPSDARVFLEYQEF
jgi:O-acetyl-ADP-ribose deacetylase (regulator of RNase III)